MSVTISNSQFTEKLSEPLEIENLLAKLFKIKEITFFIARETNEELHITCTKAGSIVIYANYNAPYVALDASRTSTWSTQKMSICIGGQPTILYKNIVITRRNALLIAKTFSMSGELLSTVYWLKEGTEEKGL